MTGKGGIATSKTVEDTVLYGNQEEQETNWRSTWALATCIPACLPVFQVLPKFTNLTWLVMMDAESPLTIRLQL